MASKRCVFYLRDDVPEERQIHEKLMAVPAKRRSEMIRTLLIKAMQEGADTPPPPRANIQGLM